MTSLDPALVPNLFLIGASKSGTSSLYAYLQHFPGVAGANPKEPCFFVARLELTELWPAMAREAVSHDPEAYLAMFRNRPAGYRLEGSVYYSQASHLAGVLGRIAAASPAARFIYLVRHPVERTMSHYWQRVRALLETRPMDEAIVPGSIYVDTSDYAMQLERYLEHVEPARIRVIMTEDLRNRRQAVLDGVAAWLDLPQLPVNAAFLAEYHASPDEVRLPRFALVRTLRDSAAWYRLRTIMPTGLRQAIGNMAVRKVHQERFDERRVRAFLADHFGARAGRLDALLGTDYEQRWFGASDPSARQAGTTR